jgi:hypothetical protein
MAKNVKITFVGKKFRRQTFSLAEIFVTKPKFRHFLPSGYFDPIVLKDLIRQKISSAKIFVGRNFRHRAKISSLFAERLL